MIGRVLDLITFFPKKWLIEDYGFTDEEATWFIDKVKQLKGG